MRRLLLAAAAALPLTACGERPPLALNVPADLLHCAGRPAVPPRKGRTQRDVAGFVSDLSDAHADCEGKLGEVRTLVEGAR